MGCNEKPYLDTAIGDRTCAETLICERNWARATVWESFLQMNHIFIVFHLLNVLTVAEEAGIACQDATAMPPKRKPRLANRCDNQPR